MNVIDSISEYFLSAFNEVSLGIKKKAQAALFSLFGLFIIDSAVFLYIFLFTDILDLYFTTAGFALVTSILISIAFLKYGKYKTAIVFINTVYIITISAVFFRCLFIDVLMGYSAVAYIMIAQVAAIYFFSTIPWLLMTSGLYLVELIVYFIIGVNYVKPEVNNTFIAGLVTSLAALLAVLVFSIAVKRVAEEALNLSESEIKKNLEQYYRIRNLNTELTMAHEELVQTSIKLTAEKERLDITLRSIGEGVISTDTNGKITLFSKMAETITGIQAHDAMDKHINDLTVFQDDRGLSMLPMDRVISYDERFDMEIILGSSRGAAKYISVKGAPITDYDFGIIGAVLVLSDVTETKRMIQELHKTSKIESLGVFAGGIAHDFNNLLTSIIGNISIARFHVKDPYLGNILDDAEKASFRAQELTHQLLTFSQGGIPIRKVTSIADLLMDTSQFVLSGSNIECRYYIQDELWNAEVDPGQISQVIQNLVINALQAMKGGGVLEIHAENYRNDGHVQVDGTEKFIKIVVRDRGHGITEGDITKIFDPYFTTKENGNGLGLAIAYSIVKKHGGSIEVNSEVGSGSDFIVYLPATDKQVHVESKIPEEETSLHGRILIMDDDDIVLNVLEKMLTQLGFNVFTAQCGEEAIELYQKYYQAGNSFDAVILDLTVPGKMGGLEAVTHLHNIDPSVKTIVSSGYSNNPIMADYTLYGFQGVMTKPYSLEELKKVLVGVLYTK